MAEQAESVEKRIENFLFETEGGEPPPGYEEKQPELKLEEPQDEPEDVRVEEKPEVKAEVKAEVEEDVEEINVSSLNDLAEALGVDVADLYKVPIPINTPDGRKEISLGEWKDSVQSMETLKAERARVSELAQQRQQEMERFTAQMQESFQQAGSVIQMAESELMRDYQSINWQELRQYDPAEFAAKQSEFGQRQAQINQAKQNAIQQMQGFEHKRRQMLEESLPEQHKRLIEMVPEFGEESTAGVEKPKVAEYLSKLGYRPEEISLAAYDARNIALAYKAMKYDELKKSQPAKKKVLKIGNKPIKPGKAQSKAEQRESANRDQRLRFKKTGNIKDLAALLNTDDFLGDL